MQCDTPPAVPELTRHTHQDPRHRIYAASGQVNWVRSGYGGGCTGVLGQDISALVNGLKIMTVPTLIPGLRVATA